MYLEAIEHIMNSQYAHATDEETVVIRLRAKKGDLKECLLFYGDRCYPTDPVAMNCLTMECVARDRLFDYFEVEFKTEYLRICYYFWLSDGLDSTFYYGNDFYNTAVCHRSKYFQLPYIRREEIADAPAWAKEAVIYQIFPDSFATAPGKITPMEKSLENKSGGRSFSKNGGTLQGICDNLPYLRDLGITCLYLNPIFTAKSWHKYDTQDYYSVDPCFGDNETLKELVRRSHQLGIKVILDGVFNHCGPNFFPFKDVMEKGEHSRYKDWFYQLELPLVYSDHPNYACFGYVKDMPKLNTGHPEVREYFTAVGTYWIREADIDGWRLDVADEVDHYFWKCFRKAVKTVKPDAFLVGEIWGDAHQWLAGDEFDSTMNYRFSNICREYFAERLVSTADFDAKWHQLRMRYRRNMTNAQMNLLDSHDVPRFLHWCDGDIRRLKLAVLFQMTVQGIPSIYYGDEKGLTGLLETEYRRPMAWDDTEASMSLTDYYRNLIGIRKKYSQAMMGEFRTLIKDSGRNIYGFTLRGGAQEVIVLFNNSDFDREVDLPVPGGATKMSDRLNNQEYRVSGTGIKLTLPAMSGAVLATD